MRWNANWGAKRGYQGRAVRWESQQKKSSTRPIIDPLSQQFSAARAEDSPEVAPESQPDANPRAHLYLQQARALWCGPCEYKYHLTLEKYEAPQLYSETEKVFHAQVSSYRARLRNPRLIEQYEAKVEKQIRDTVSVLRRRRSAHVIPFSTWARSISYFNQRVPTRVWKDQQRGMRIGQYRLHSLSSHLILS